MVARARRARRPRPFEARACTARLARTSRDRTSCPWSAEPMDRYERIVNLHRTLKAARYPVPLPKLMDELGCSRATLYRDIAFLRDALGAPIDSAGEQRGIAYAKDEGERFELPGLWLSSEELSALLALQQLLERTGPGMLTGTLA